VAWSTTTSPPSLTQHRRANTQTANRTEDTRAVFLEAREPCQTPPDSSPSLLPFISTPARPLCLPARPASPRPKHCTLINSILALSVSFIHTPPLFQPEKPCCRHYHYRQPFWNNKRARQTPTLSVPSAKTTTSTLVSTTRTVVCAQLITTRPRPFIQRADEPTNQRALPQGHYFQESPSVSSASLGPTLAASCHPLRVKARARRPRHPGRGPVPVDLLLDHAISTGTSSAHAAVRRLGPDLQSALFPLRTRYLIIVTLLQDQPHSFTYPT
jgi:hypothetical protein